MKILGVDPGLVHTGFGIISYEKVVKALDFGIISPDKDSPLSLRLNTIYSDMKSLIKKYKPDCLSVEEVFYSNNIKTTMKLGQARGAVLIAAAHFNLQVYEYSARKIKLSLTGNGSSTKEQVQFMVKKLLLMDKLPQPIDASDALAIAICYILQNKLGAL